LIVRIVGAVPIAHIEARAADTGPVPPQDAGHAGLEEGGHSAFSFGTILAVGLLLLVFARLIGMVKKSGRQKMRAE
jgi:hypothetical protein